MAVGLSDDVLQESSVWLGCIVRCSDPVSWIPGEASTKYNDLLGSNSCRPYVEYFAILDFASLASRLAT